MSPEKLSIAPATQAHATPHVGRLAPRRVAVSRQQTPDMPARRVIGPMGAPLAISDLPPANTQRWVARRKAEVVAAVRGGLLTFDEASKRYSLSLEEFLSWQRAMRLYGLAGLQTGK